MKIKVTFQYDIITNLILIISFTFFLSSTSLLDVAIQSINKSVFYFENLAPGAARKKLNHIGNCAATSLELARMLQKSNESIVTPSEATYLFDHIHEVLASKEESTSAATSFKKTFLRIISEGAELSIQQMTSLCTNDVY